MQVVYGCDSTQLRDRFCQGSAQMLSGSSPDAVRARCSFDVDSGRQSEQALSLRLALDLTLALPFDFDYACRADF